MSDTIRIGNVVDCLDNIFPLSTQDSWDNSGLIVGSRDWTLKGILFTVDITSQRVDEAIQRGCNLIVSHHPILFRGLKRLNGNSDEERTIEKAIVNKVGLCAFHTPLDKSTRGTSYTLGRKLGLVNMTTLVAERDSLFKLSTYVPDTHAEAVRTAMLDAGAGHIGNYSHCSYNIQGIGTFLAGQDANPFVGNVGQLHSEAEVRIETICPSHLLHRVTTAMLKAHPYEEPAYDVFPLANENHVLGYGVVGELSQSLSTDNFIHLLKQQLGCPSIRTNSDWAGRDIRRVTICTGSGSEFIGKAMRAKADAYITADMKYHQFQQAEGRILIADVGHYESEDVSKNIFYDILKEKFPTFALCISDTCKNTIKYY